MRQDAKYTLLLVILGAGLFAAVLLLMIDLWPKSRAPQTIPPASVQSFLTPGAVPELGPPSSSPEASKPAPEPAVQPKLYTYIAVSDSCGPYYAEPCLNVRSGPGKEYPSSGYLRNGMVLKVKETVTNEQGKWYKVYFDEWVRYPERIKGDWYVAADYVQEFSDEGTLEWTGTEKASTTKLIVVDRSEQMLYAYDGVDLFMKSPISTGLDATPTPRGQFFVYRKTPSRYMQGPLPGVSDQYYDLPGVPWNLFFTYQGAVVHGAYWHDKFGQAWSHGCVNLFPDTAKNLYEWAEVGTPVHIRD